MDTSLNATTSHISLLLLAAVVIAIVSRRMRLPYTVGLVCAGAAMAFGHVQFGIHASKTLIFVLFLPPLIFEAAFKLRWDELKRDFVPLITHGMLGVTVAGTVMFFGCTTLMGWDWRPALLFSVLISATDPVSVIAMLKDAGLGGRLRLLIEGESLFNDGAAATFFTIALVAVSGVTPTVGSVTVSLVQIAGGGVLCGIVIGLLCVALMGRTNDHLIEVSVTVVAAYGAFEFAEAFHMSGVLSTLAAGIVMGNVGPLQALTDLGHETADSFWDLAAFFSNSLLFLLMGEVIAHGDYVRAGAEALVCILLMLASRAASVYGVSALFARSRYRIKPLHQHLMVWGGLRGALALALALGLPEDLPSREAVLTATFGVVAFSVVLQGLSISPYLNRLAKTASAPMLD